MVATKCLPGYPARRSVPVSIVQSAGVAELAWRLRLVVDRSLRISVHWVFGRAGRLPPSRHRAPFGFARKRRLRHRRICASILHGTGVRHRRSCHSVVLLGLGVLALERCSAKCVPGIKHLRGIFTPLRPAANNSLYPVYFSAPFLVTFLLKRNGPNGFLSPGVLLGLASFLFALAIAAPQIVPFVDFLTSGHASTNHEIEFGRSWWQGTLPSSAKSHFPLFRRHSPLRNLASKSGCLSRGLGGFSCRLFCLRRRFVIRGSSDFAY